MSNQTMAQPANMRTFFANRFDQSILLSNFFLQMGIWVRNFAILLFVTEQTDKNPYAISLIAVAEYAPIFLFSFIGGAFADRWRPKRTMIICDSLSALSVFGVLLALVYGGWQAIFFATLVSSILSQFSQPSGMKLFKIHVPDSLMHAGMSMYQTISSIFMILGPIFGTIIYTRFGITTAIAIMGVCFVLSALVLTRLPKDQKVEVQPSSNVTKEMKTGLSYVLSNTLFVYMGAFFLTCGLGLGLINTLNIFLVTDHLGLTAEHLQWFTAINGIGMIVGGVGGMALAKKMPPQMQLLLGFSVMTITVITLGTVKIIWIVLIAQFISGIMAPLIHISCNTLIIGNAEQQFVGRVNGILNPLFIGGMVVTMSLVGVLKEQFSLSTIYMFAALLFAIGAIIVFPMLRLRQLRKVEMASSFQH